MYVFMRMPFKNDVNFTHNFIFIDKRKIKIYKFKHLKKIASVGSPTNKQFSVESVIIKTGSIEISQQMTNKKPTCILNI